MVDEKKIKTLKKILVRFFAMGAIIINWYLFNQDNFLCGDVNADSRGYTFISERIVGFKSPNKISTINAHGERHTFELENELKDRHFAKRDFIKVLQERA